MQQMRQMKLLLLLSSLIGASGAKLAAQQGKFSINVDELVEQAEHEEENDAENDLAMQQVTEEAILSANLNSTTVCAPGYNKTPATGDLCVDIDECKVQSTQNCRGLSQCENTVGSYRCKCRVGYDGYEPNCVNRNECVKGVSDKVTKVGNITTTVMAKNNTCNATLNQLCTDTDGSFNCLCKTGFGVVGNGSGAFVAGSPRTPQYQNCSNLNECLTGTANCAPDANCTDTRGSFTCKCKVGFWGDGVSCADFDECVMGLHTCDENAHCLNTPGSFKCQCRRGWSGNGFNTPISSSIKGTGCQDINECVVPKPAFNEPTLVDSFNGTRSGVHNCGKNITEAKCVNTPGSHICHCQDGFSGDGVTCTNINECLLKANACPTQSTCRDTQGSYVCTCKPGWKWSNGRDGEFGTCININECTDNALKRRPVTGGTTTTTTTVIYPPWMALAEEGAGSASGNWPNMTPVIPPPLCSGQGWCYDTQGSFECRCPPGWIGDGRSCFNANECTSGIHNCDYHATCEDTQGSFKCRCHAGYNGTGTRYTGAWPPIDGCWDIDECVEKTQEALKDLSNHSAWWNYSQFRLAQQRTYGWIDLTMRPPQIFCDAKLRIGVPEYITKVTANCSRFCGHNVSDNLTISTNYTATCGNEVKKLQEHKTQRATACVIGAECFNTVGSYSCKCGPGWVGDGLTCTDLDECRMETHACPAQTTCNNTLGSYECLCNQGWISLGLGGYSRPRTGPCMSNKKFEVAQAVFQANATYGWQKVNFTSDFGVKPIVYLQVPIQTAREIVPRVRKVTTSGFEFTISFANSTNATEDQLFWVWLTQHVTSVSYMAVAKGIHSLPNGTVVIAGFGEKFMRQMMRSTNCMESKNKQWDKIEFGHNFTQRPVLFSSLQDMGESAYPGGGMHSYGFCYSAVRWNLTLNESNNTNDSAYVVRICPNIAGYPMYTGPDNIGWIAIGSNVSNGTNATNNMTSHMKYDNKSVFYASYVVNRNISGNDAVENVEFGRSFQKAPLVFTGKVATNKFSVGWLQFIGPGSQQASFRNNEDRKSCPSLRRKEEYFNMFVAEKVISV